MTAALGLALAIALGWGAATAATDEPTLVDAEARLAAVNALARAHYADAKRAALVATDPVIVVTAEELILRRDGAVESVAYLPARYRHLKALGHVALGAWSLLAPHAGRPAAPLAPALATYRAHVAALEPVVGTLGLRWDDAKRQREILSLSLGLIEDVTSSGTVALARLEAYAYDIGPALLGNAYDAAEAQLEALHGVVQRWRAALPPDAWRRLHVVVLGPTQPREAQPPYLYFRRLLGPDAAARVVAADNLTDSAAALDRLAAAVHDRTLAASFFGNAARLERGLLSEATQRHLERLLAP